MPADGRWDLIRLLKLKLKFSRPTQSATENRKASGLCPTQMFRAGVSTDRANGGRKRERESYVRGPCCGQCSPDSVSKEASLSA